MPTICPNCLRPVRTDAIFCGFCGTNLKPAAHEEGAVAIAPNLESDVTNENPTAQKQLKSKGNRIKRIVLITVIALLCLVLLLAFLIHYWPVFPIH
jgi:hypothetical protein